MINSKKIYFEDYHLLGYGIIWSGSPLPMFWITLHLHFGVEEDSGAVASQKSVMFKVTAI
jgi:hypothetical protein